MARVLKISENYVFIMHVIMIRSKHATAHSTFKMSEWVHKFKVTRQIGTPVHEKLPKNMQFGLIKKI